MYGTMTTKNSVVETGKANGEITKAKFTATILGVSIPALLILTFSVLIYLLMIRRYQIVKRSVYGKQKHHIQEDEVVAEGVLAEIGVPLFGTHPDEQKGPHKTGISEGEVEYMCKGQHYEQSEGEEEEDAIYDDFGLRTPTFSNGDNLYNTLINDRCYITESSEQESYSVLNKLTRNKQLLTMSQQQMKEASDTEGEYDSLDQKKTEDDEVPARDDAVYSTICRENKAKEHADLRQKLRSEHRDSQRVPEDTEYNKHLNESSMLANCQEPSKSQQETTECENHEGEYNVIGSVKSQLDEYYEEQNYNVLDKSCRTFTQAAQENQESSKLDNPSRRIRPPKETPLSKRYSCNLDLNNTLIHQQSCGIADEEWDNGSGEDEGHYQVPDELKLELKG
ncbi:hypothetical protein ACHWQZ_G018162 [Mnemiopsis leidyi]